MARNPVQFQKGISLNAFLSLYGTEDQCFDALYQWRWPNGFLCPHCGHDRSCQLKQPQAPTVQSLPPPDLDHRRKPSSTPPSCPSRCGFRPSTS